MTFDMRSRRFWNKSDTSWKYPAKIFVHRSIFHRNTIYRSVIIEVNWSLQISAHKEDGVLFSLLFLCASRKTHRQTVSASAVNLLRQKRKKGTLAETLKKNWGFQVRVLVQWILSSHHSSGLKLRVCNRKIIFLFLIQNICCGYSKEPSQWDCSFEHLQHMLHIIGKKIFTILRWN